MPKISKLETEFSKLGLDLTNSSQITDVTIQDIVKKGKVPITAFVDFFTYFVSEFLTDGKTIEVNPYDLDSEEEWIKLITIKYFESKGLVFPKNSAETKFALSWYGKRIMDQGGFSKFINPTSKKISEGFNMEDFKRSRRESFQLKVAEESHGFAKESNNSTWYLSISTFVLAITTVALVIVTILK